MSLFEMACSVVVFRYCKCYFGTDLTSCFWWVVQCNQKLLILFFIIYLDSCFTFTFILMFHGYWNLFYFRLQNSGWKKSKHQCINWKEDKKHNKVRQCRVQVRCIVSSHSSSSTDLLLQHSFYRTLDSKE